MPQISFSPENTTRRVRTEEVIEIPVESESRPGTKHYVSVRVSCTCEAFRYRNLCKHIHATLDAIAPRPKKMEE